MSESYARVQYLYLVRLAWSLRRIGLNTTVDVPGRDDPAVLVPADTGRVRVAPMRTLAAVATVALAVAGCGSSRPGKGRVGYTPGGRSGTRSCGPTLRRRRGESPG